MHINSFRHVGERVITGSKTAFQLIMNIVDFVCSCSFVLLKVYLTNGQSLNLFLSREKCSLFVGG